MYVASSPWISSLLPAAAAAPVGVEEVAVDLPDRPPRRVLEEVDAVVVELLLSVLAFSFSRFTLAYW